VSAQQGVGNWWVSKLTMGYQYDRRLKVQLVVDNVFDKQPPYPLPATPYGPDFFAYWSGLLGRYFTVQASYRF
jgi:iron complex outermembrane receptor protein